MKDINLKKIIFSISLFLVYGTILSIAAPSESKQKSINNFKNFVDLCKNKDVLAQNVKYTIDQLLVVANTSDCAIAENSLKKFQVISLERKSIVDISPLMYFTKLKSLNLRNNQIIDISSLSSLTDLVMLNLNENQIVNIQSLEKLTKLTELGISGNRISDISPLRNLTNLTILSAKRNQITDVTPLKGLIELRYLFLRDNKITDISSLQSLRNISVNSGIFTGNPIINKTCPFRKEVICRF
jgi:internalin A